MHLYLLNCWKPYHIVKLTYNHAEFTATASWKLVFETVSCKNVFCIVTAGVLATNDAKVWKRYMTSQLSLRCNIVLYIKEMA